MIRGKLRKGPLTLTLGQPVAGWVLNGAYDGYCCVGVDNPFTGN